MIDRQSYTPLYVQLANTIREKIKSGEIKIGDKLPSETEMIKEYGLGRLTVRDGIAILVNEGLVAKHHGKGSFCIASPSDEKAGLSFELLLDTTDVYFVPYYLHSICEVLEGEKCDISIRDTKDDTKNICALIDKIIERGCDGVIIQPSSEYGKVTEELKNSFKRLDESNIPYILLDGIYNIKSLSYVVLDEYKAGVLAAGYFLEKGHRKLCIISKEGKHDAAERRAGFEDALEDAPFVLNYDASLEEALPRLLDEHPEITGIFCYNDLAATKCYRILESSGRSIPEDISVVSMDDTIIASTLSPSITSVSHPKSSMGKMAALALLNIVNGNSRPPYQKVFTSTIIERESVKSIV